MATESEEQTMTSQETCEALGISLATLHRRVAEGELKPLPKAPGAKRHHRLLFLKLDIQQFLKEAAL